MDQNIQKGTDADVIFSGTDALNRRWNAAADRPLDLRNVTVSDADLSGAILRNADLSGAVFRNCKLCGSSLDGALLSGSAFIRCDMHGCTIRSTNLTCTTMENTALDDCDFSGSAGFSQIKRIESCYLRDEGTDVIFDIDECRPLDRLVSWNKIRVIGRLRLFVPSYFALGTSLLVMMAVGFMNERLVAGRNVVRHLAEAGVIAQPVAAQLIFALQPIHSSWRHLATLLSTLAIALGSTLYLLCPSKVKEFTLEQWMYQAGRPAFEYHVHTWNRPRVRLWCMAAYYVGGGIAVILLGSTLLDAIRLILADFTA